jgi:hypothetical protein
MEWQILAAFLPVVVALIGVWVNLNSTVARLKGRVVQLELENNDFKKVAKELLESVHRLEIMITKMQK